MGCSGLVDSCDNVDGPINVSIDGLAQAFLRPALGGEIAKAIRDCFRNGPNLGEMPRNEFRRTRYRKRSCEMWTLSGWGEAQNFGCSGGLKGWKLASMILIQKSKGADKEKKKGGYEVSRKQ